ncbi:MAG TPA: hypothetical protein VGE70_11695, partial [Burkholderiaceae bacterium]
GGGLPGLDVLTGLLGGLPILGGLGGLGGTSSAAVEGGATVSDGSNSASLALGLPGLDLLGSLPGLGGGLPLPGLGGGGGAEANGSVFGTSDGPIGGLLYTLESSAYGIPILGEFAGGAIGSQVEGGGIQIVLLTQLYGTPAFGPIQSLIGGNSYGDELILYDLATRPVGLTEGLPIINDLTREVVTGGLAGPTAFIGAYSGGLLSEDFLQYLVTPTGTLGALADAGESGLVGVPGLGLLFDGDNLNSSLDLVTNAVDQILYVDDITAGLLGGDKLSNHLPFDNVLAQTGLGEASAGLLAPVGDAFYPAITPLLTMVQEVAIAGAIINGTLGKVI